MCGGSLGRILHGQRHPAGIGGKGIERCRDRTTNPSPEETLPAVFLTLLSQVSFWAGIPSKDLLMRFTVLFTSSSPEWLAGGLSTVSLAPRPVPPEPSLLAHELHASLKTLQPLSLLSQLTSCVPFLASQSQAQDLLLLSWPLFCLSRPPPSPHLSWPSLSLLPPQLPPLDAEHGHRFKPTLFLPQACLHPHVLFLPCHHQPSRQGVLSPCVSLSSPILPPQDESGSCYTSGSPGCHMVEAP